ncbi:hypothetical protein [Novosphingobium colocasiae]|uniref:Uncharacterized protein n=1 Tax=Novosphingobium colocasiae TaxID=1256513 RepID=A0A918PI13_9SPHN|nr:hypothetical protein [Novosphingobium colocasiae]GGZ10849.1 hypothetical protein GCM10011614_27310 [Novosphingobium colocasiae]
MADRKKPQGSDFIYDARHELAGMLEEGLSHPSTKPVLAYGALGAVAAVVLPFVGVPLGFAAGAGYKFYKRLRPD